MSNEPRILHFVLTSGESPVVDVSLTAQMVLPPNTKFVVRSCALSGRPRDSVVVGKYAWHYLADGPLLFLCACDLDFPMRIAFAFLTDVRHRLGESELASMLLPGEGAKAPAISARTVARFKAEASERLRYYSTAKEADALRRLESELMSLREDIGSNVDRVLDRGENISLLAARAHTIDPTGLHFRKRAITQSRRSIWRSCWLWSFIVVLLIALAYFITAFCCGGLLLPKCIGPHESIAWSLSSPSAVTLSFSHSAAHVARPSVFPLPTAPQGMRAGHRSPVAGVAALVARRLR